MLIENPGKINDHIEMLGSAEIPFYLVKGKEWAIIDAGVSAAVPLLFEQFKNYPEIQNKLKYLILTHSHFDHTGALPALLFKFPQVKVLASEVTKEVFSKPKALEYIKGMNSAIAKFAGIELDKICPKDVPYRVDRTIKEPDEIDLGDNLLLKVYNAPGHSRCSLVLFLLPDKALFSGEAIGFYNQKDQILPEALSSFSDYINSLKKASELNPDIICLPHGGVLTNDDAKNYFTLALSCTMKFQDELKAKIKSSKTDDEILNEMSDKYYRGKITLQPKEVFLGNLRAMLLALKKTSAIKHP